MPFGLLNLRWNYENCWANLMFNLYNRHDDAGFSWKSPLLYALITLYVISPIALGQVVRGATHLRSRWSDPGTRFLVIAVAVPFALFGVLSMVK